MRDIVSVPILDNYNIQDIYPNNCFNQSRETKTQA